MELDPETLAPRERYKPLIGCIVLRPVAFASFLAVARVRAEHTWGATGP
ncbi:MAG: hypothetical protein HZA53_11105 [Planctomycetes bacterium]|nr:hypothetical protein [Planctomycetota bacterium]